jgi:hypothetical protein
MSETISATYTLVAPTLLGVWVFDPTTADASDTNFLFAQAASRTEEIDPAATALLFDGRLNPVIEYGVSLQVDLKVTILVPLDIYHDANVQYWRNVVANKRTIVYRDGRGRLIYLALGGKLAIADGIAGTAISVPGVRVDYNVVVA